LVAEVKKRGFVADPVRRSWDLLAVTDEFEAWVIGWPAGGAIEFHDHGESKGAVVVLSGELLETRVVHRGPTLIGTRATTLSVGDTVELPSNCVHDVVNGGRTPAVSVHVYSPRLRSMTYYDLAERVLEPVRTVQYDDLG
jgi:mannose-6-phosphate isomerase-like protein (cupin superfamily)